MDFKIKPDSWHYWLATRADAYVVRWEDEIDICTYARQVVKGVSLCLFVVFLGVLVGLCFVSFYTTVAVLLAYDVSLSKDTAFLALPFFAWGAVIHLGVIGMGLFILIRKAHPLSRVQGPTFIGEAWRAHKKKYCVIVPIEREGK